MTYRDGRRSLCLSSQSGCPLTCTFCATGQMRFRRNLTASGIVDQALHFRRQGPISHVVFMGMGEPMLQPRPCARCGRAAPGPRYHAPENDGLHRRVAARPDALRRRGDGAHSTGPVAARAGRRAALTADARQRALPAGRRPRRVPALRGVEAAEGLRRVRDLAGVNDRVDRRDSWLRCSSPVSSRSTSSPTTRPEPSTARPAGDRRVQARARPRRAARDLRLTPRATSTPPAVSWLRSAPRSQAVDFLRRVPPAVAWRVEREREASGSERASCPRRPASARTSSSSAR